MSDISKCEGNNNKLCNRCYRKTMIGGEMQSYIGAKAVGGVCDYFKPISKRRKK